MEYGDRGKAVWVDGALVHKTVHDAFKFIPVERRLSALDAWLFDTLEWIEQIEHWKLILTDIQTKPLEPVLRAFPKNTEGCYKYNKLCPYFDVCRFTDNPEKIPTPPGFEVKKWEPFDILGIEKLGLENEDAS